ncbi:MAG: pilus assembly protein TadG-related protein [Pseudomonadota bacterium]
MFKKFSRNADGNMAILAGFMLLPAILLLGGGYDVMRATSNTVKLRSVLESAALAAASLTNAQEVEAVVADYMDSNLVKDPQIRNSLTVAVVESSALNSKTVEIQASAVIPTFFLRIAGINELPVKASTKANQSKTTLELALVLDISSSMRGAKLANLQTSAEDFVEKILNDENIDHTSMSLIPFGGTVNIGPLFSTYAVTEGGATVDPTEAQYDIGSAVLTSNFRFTGADLCIEHQDADFNDDMLPMASRSQVPDFWKWWNNHPWCPAADSAVMMNTNDRDALKTHVSNLVLSDGTGMDIGMLWGAKALSPDWVGQLGGDFADRPHPYNSDAMKVMVVMTDGEITQQYRPEDPSLKNVHTNRPDNYAANTNAEGVNAGVFKNEHGNADNANQQTIVNKGSSSSQPSGNDGVAHFKRLCDEARANNVIVYTIGFNINQNKISHELLGYCASDPSKYYFVESLDIGSAFDSIAASVNALRIVG